MPLVFLPASSIVVQRYRFFVLYLITSLSKLLEISCPLSHLTHSVMGKGEELSVYIGALNLFILGEQVFFFICCMHLKAF